MSRARRVAPATPATPWALITGALAAAAVAAWAWHSRPAQAAGPLVVPGASILSCGNAAGVDAPYGRVVNNRWNQASAGAGDWQQCLIGRPGPGGQQELGWAWRWPTRDGLYAYPHVLVGLSPWHAAPSNDPRFPRRLADTRVLRFTHDFEQLGSGKQNLAADIWITTRAPVPGAPPDPSILKAELMVWLHASPGLVDPAARPVGEALVQGERWPLHVRAGWADASGGSTQRWTLISYHAPHMRLAGTVDVQALLQDAQARGLLAPGDWVTGVELGNELVSGSGHTWVRQFSVQAE